MLIQFIASYIKTNLVYCFEHSLMDPHWSPGLLV